MHVIDFIFEGCKKITYNESEIEKLSTSPGDRENGNLTVAIKIFVF